MGVIVKKAFSLILFIFSILISSFSGVTAQDLGVLGEIRSSGEVFISGSGGKWTPAMQTYPLLQNTGIKTENGSVSVFLKDGSRFDLSGNTLVSITGAAPDYKINLAKGTIAFNIVPISSVSLSTPSASIEINSRSEMVRKVGHENSGRILGVVSATEKGTEVTSVSGNIKVTSSAAGTKMVGTGERLIFAPGSNYQVYKTQVPGDVLEESNHRQQATVLAGAIGGGAGILGGLDRVLPGGRRFASPSTFK
jgi:hypothetical protein